MENTCADAQPSTMQLIAMLRDAQESVRVCAAVRLGSPKRADPSVISALIELLRSSESIDRRVAALALGKIGPAAGEALPALLEAMEETSDSGFPNFALEAIARISQHATRPLAA